MLAHPSQELAVMPKRRHHALPRARVIHTAAPWRNRAKVAKLSLPLSCRPLDVWAVEAASSRGATGCCWIPTSATTLQTSMVSAWHRPNSSAVEVSGTTNYTSSSWARCCDCGREHAATLHDKARRMTAVLYCIVAVKFTVTGTCQ